MDFVHLVRQNVGMSRQKLQDVNRVHCTERPGDGKLHAKVTRIVLCFIQKSEILYCRSLISISNP